MEQKTHTLYLQCHAGISGDMLVGCLLDLGVDKDVLVSALNTLPLEGFRIAVRETKKSGLRAMDFDVILAEGFENFDHDMGYLYGEADAETDHGHHHEEHPGHHGHPEHPGHHGHPEHAGHPDHPAHPEHPDPGPAHHFHTRLADIRRIIGESGLSEHAKDLVLRIFHILGEAEANAHGEALEDVVFHEVGAVDSIVDIAAVAVCIDQLDITDVVVSPLSEGEGTVRCAHGLLPVPVPAVCHICGEYGLILHPLHVKGEFVTPTGAACAAALKTASRLPEKYRILKTGYGAGKRTHSLPGILRGMLIEEEV